MKRIISNKVKCLRCGDIIESLHLHDFKWCSCESIAVDGGNCYLRRGFAQGIKGEDYIELSEYEEDGQYEANTD